MFEKRKRITMPLLLSRMISVLGNTAAAVILPIVLLEKTGSPLAAGTLSLACGLPQFLAGVFGGAALDRFNRRNISVLSDLISAVCVAALPLTDRICGLSFGWFLFFGILGAIGDIPGMTARGVLLPAAVKQDGLDLQRFVGISQALDSLAGILGPAAAALLISWIGGPASLWVTSSLSLLAALITLTVPRSIGTVGAQSDEKTADPPANPLRAGLHIILKTDRRIPAAMLLSAGILMIAASYQELIFPVHFTQIGRPQLVGYMFSMMALGLLIGPALYSIFMQKLKRRTWYVLSISGAAAGMTIMGTLASEPAILFGAALAGACCGSFSALLGYLILEKVPEETLGSVLGMQNAFFLAAPPAAVFICSLLVTGFGTRIASFLLIGLLLFFAFAALRIKSMRNL